jgi:hypothetical protein
VAAAIGHVWRVQSHTAPYTPVRFYMHTLRTLFANVFAHVSHGTHVHACRPDVCTGVPHVCNVSRACMRVRVRTGLRAVSVVALLLSWCRHGCKALAEELV